MITAFVSISLAHVPLIILSFVVTKALFNKYAYGLSSLPGPRLAAYTGLWHFWTVCKWRAHYVQMDLHKRMGEVVRLGPNNVSVTRLDIIKQIYGPSSSFVKSSFYPVIQNVEHGKVVESMFDTTDQRFHAKSKRMVAGFYSMSGVVQFEPLVDSTIKVFMKELDRRYATTLNVCPFHSWLNYFAFDVIGEMTFSRRLGFLERGVDVEGIISKIKTTLQYFTVVGQIPWLDYLLKKNPLRLWLGAMGMLKSEAPVFAFTSKEMVDHIRELEQSEGNPQKSSRRDYLKQFLQARSKDPEFMTDTTILNYAHMNVFAGSDTTGITLTAIFYYLLKTPSAYKALMKELESTSFEREDGVVTWNEARNLPYLTAVMNEGLRIHPAIGLVLERVVPAGGLQVGKHFLPKGTVVGANAWVVHQNEEIFGSNPQEFRPERWLEVSEQKNGEMRNALFSFGMGPTTCIGKNVSLLEIYKLVPSLLRMFEFTLANPDYEWSVENHWLVKQSNFNVRVSRRAS